MSKRKLSSVQVFENIVVPDVSTNVNKNLVAGTNTVQPSHDLALELQDDMVLATFTSTRTKKAITMGIPLSFVRTLVFEA